jgi:hypothetical protein
MSRFKAVLKGALLCAALSAAAAVTGCNSDDGNPTNTANPNTGTGGEPSAVALTGSVSIPVPITNYTEEVTANTDNLDGSGEISYQWMQKPYEEDTWTDIEGETNASLLSPKNFLGKIIKVRVSRADNTGFVYSNDVLVSLLIRETWRGGDLTQEDCILCNTPLYTQNETVGKAEVTLFHAQHRTSGNSEIRLIKNIEELTSYMEVSGCGDGSNIACLETAREIAGGADFKKYTYFVDGGKAPRRTDWKIISETESIVTINYIEWQLPECNPPIGWYIMAPSFEVYFIPFTEKQIEFTETVDYYKCRD